MVSYILLFFSVCFSALYSSLHNYFSNHEVRNTRDSFTITSYTYAIGAASLLCLMALTWTSISVYTVVFGIAFGVVTALNCIFMLKAFSSGPMSFTVLITTSAMILPGFSGAIIWQEELSIWKVVGTALMIVSVYFTAVRNGGSASVKWLLYTLANFLCIGIIGIMQKFQQYSAYASESTPFLTVAFITTAAVSFVLSKISGAGNASVNRRRFSGKTWVLFAISGLLVAFLNVVNLYLSGALPSAIMFPVQNGGTTVLTVLSAIVVFREKLNRRRIIGLAISTVALLLLLM